MNDNAMVERWNVIDSAAMAVAVESVLYRLTKNKPLPFDVDEALKNGIGFLEEAQNGGAIICGEPESSEFNGTLTPLVWSTNIYINISKPSEEGMYKKIVATLKSYRDLLEKIRKEEVKELGSKADIETAKTAYDFFHQLARELMKQADPVTESYSHRI